MKGIYYWIDKRASIHPDRLAIITEHEKWSYKKLNEKINRAVHLLKEELKVEKGDRIGILSNNSAEYVVLLFAIAKIQCIAVPLNVRLTESELSYQIQDSGVTYLFFEQPFKQVSENMREKIGFQLYSLERLCSVELVSAFNEVGDIDEPYIICYTSGTTGKPKGAILTQGNMFYNALNNVTAIDITSQDRSIVLLPLFHIGGIGLFAFPTLFVGGTIIIPHRFNIPKILEMIAINRVTIVMGVPVMHQQLINSHNFNKTDLTSVRLFYSGGAPCPPSLINRFIAKGFNFGQGFGLTETSPTVFMLSVEDASRKIGSVGKPVLFNDIKIVDENNEQVMPNEVGSLLVKGNNVFKGYWNNDEATEEAFWGDWFVTGDVAKADKEGFIYIIGRKKEMIISGGENIYPSEIEKIISELKEIEEVAVIGLEDDKWGEVPIAFIALRNENTIEKEQIISHCKKYLANYKVPKLITFLKSLPKNSTGKIQKNQLIKYLQE